MVMFGESEEWKKPEMENSQELTFVGDNPSIRDLAPSIQSLTWLMGTRIIVCV